MTNSVDLRIKISVPMNTALLTKADNLGITVSELVRHYLLNELKDELRKPTSQKTGNGE